MSYIPAFSHLFPCMSFPFLSSTLSLSSTTSVLPNDSRVLRLGNTAARERRMRDLSESVRRRRGGSHQATCGLDSNWIIMFATFASKCLVRVIGNSKKKKNLGANGMDKRRLESNIVPTRREKG